MTVKAFFTKCKRIWDEYQLPVETKVCEFGSISAILALLEEQLNVVTSLSTKTSLSDNGHHRGLMSSTRETNVVDGSLSGLCTWLADASRWGRPNSSLAVQMLGHQSASLVFSRGSSSSSDLIIYTSN